jgi:hypothetical protein
MILVFILPSFKRRPFQILFPKNVLLTQTYRLPLPYCISKKRNISVCINKELTKKHPKELYALPEASLRYLLE